MSTIVDANESQGRPTHPLETHGGMSSGSPPGHGAGWFADRVACYRIRYRTPNDEERQVAYVTEKRGVFYAVIYEGRNPVSGRERRRWHRCEDHVSATKLATELTVRRSRQRSAGSSLTLGEYL